MPQPEIASQISKVRAIRWREPALDWGLVPTMGALHAGHLSLVSRARRENARVAVSIFVNPAQFDNPADLDKYPRDLDRDLELLRKAGVDLIWTPTPEVVYPDGYLTYVDVEELAHRLEGAARPGHFRGVATVVAKLFNVVQPRRAYFGQKDAQQVVLIKRMVEDLNFNLEIVVCPIEREDDGLAMSSRNVRLSHRARAEAICLFRALEAARSAIVNGERRGKAIRDVMRSVIDGYPLAQVDYVSVADPLTLLEQESVEKPILLSLAVFVDGVRLIDNLLLEE